MTELKFRPSRILAALAVALLGGCGGMTRDDTAPAPATDAVAPAAVEARVPQPPLVSVRDGQYQPKPPIADRRDHDIVAPAGTRNDPYYWLRDDKREAPDVLEYLNAERAYHDEMFAPLDGARQALYDEIVARLPPEDDTVPVRKNGWWYYRRFVAGGEYPVYARRRDVPDAPEQILLDGNAMARGHDFFMIGNYEVTTDGNTLAWTEDTVGRRQMTMRFKNLTNDTVLPDAIANVEPDIAWAGDHRTVLYLSKDPVTLLASKVKRHVLGSDVARDTLVFEEKDPSFYVNVDRTRSDRFVCILSNATVSTEQRCADAADPKLTFRVLIPRERDHEYQAEDHGDRWIVRTNWRAPNFRIVSAPMNAPATREQWRDVLAHRTDAFVQEFYTFDDFLAVSERSGGLANVRIVRWDGGEQRLVKADEPTYVMTIDENPETGSGTLRYRFQSIATPPTVYDYAMATGERALRKREPVLGDFDPSRYATEFVRATARDGTEIPVSIAYRRDTPRDGTAPLYVTGYGSYGINFDPYFMSQRLSLLDRGVVVAFAHIRGGQELGRAWYENGRRLHKINTFTDFIDATDWLVQHGYGAKDRVIAQGGSAGGLLMGAIANMAPDRYRVILAAVPFVDVVTTMLDTSIPLTTNEFDEWGDPKKPEYYEYMLSYSPYDNVTAQDYPAMLVNTGLWDSQVQYFEPAKWVAKLRAEKTDRMPLLFRINMTAGHGGRSGRFRRLEQTAAEYAFALDQVRVSLPNTKLVEKRQPPPE